ncbi:MAG: methyltransferase domain-containing protein [Chloroflexi bacterium]|nr:methyltransferase domain-containing protein [Chloroflexota bacterium]
MADEGSRRGDGLAWQTSVWDRMSDVYLREIDERFRPVVENVIARAALNPGQQVLDLGTGTGSVALRAAPLVIPGGRVLCVDISAEMLKLAERRASEARLDNVTFREGGGEAIPAEDKSTDVLLASLSMMYVIDRSAAARECARILRPDGRFVASVWAGPDHCDIVRLQQTAARFAPPPPVPNVGPGALADPTSFLVQLDEAGIDARVETESTSFDFPDFASAWDTLAGVTAGQMTPEQREEARATVFATLWPEGDGPRRFVNLTQFIVGNKRR